MTKREKIIVSAYTGFLMCDFSDVHEYIQKKFGRPVFTHELANKGIQKAVKEMSKKEFLEICNREEPERKKGEWKHTGVTKSYRFICSACGKTAYYVSGSCASTRNKIENICKYNFCPNCGADMRGVKDD